MTKAKKPKTDDDIYTFFNSGIYLPTKTLYMGEEDGTEHTMVEKTIKGLHILDTVAGGNTITIIMNNYGGDEYYGMAIYDAIKQCKNRTIIEATGYVMSMGALILQAADERIMAPNATMMIHYGSMYFEGHSLDMKMASKENDRLCKMIEDILLKRIKKKNPDYTREKLQELMKFDKFLTAKEAIKLGLADKLITDGD